MLPSLLLHVDEVFWDYALQHIDRGAVRSEQARRREARGGFARRLQLLWTDEP